MYARIIWCVHKTCRALTLHYMASSLQSIHNWPTSILKKESLHLGPSMKQCEWMDIKKLCCFFCCLFFGQIIKLCYLFIYFWWILTLSLVGRLTWYHSKFENKNKNFKLCIEYWLWIGKWADQSLIKSIITLSIHVILELALRPHKIILLVKKLRLHYKTNW